ncbi:MAG: response regulator [Gammaproteobacteria bacterium]|jgi:CheY-like chemotaxis protein|nr:response regulator [Gammaproteobacteria bacterium]MBT6559509.1 response regulator [Gammaproteobacteria bacterium]
MKSMHSQLLSLAAPDIRTTLNTIQGTLSLVGHKLNATEGTIEQTLVQHANLSIQHLISLLQTVSDLDLIENQMMPVSNQRVDLGQLIESIVDKVLLDPRASQVAIVVSYTEAINEASVAEFVVDEDKFTQSFTAVLQYAVMFSRRERVDILVCKTPAGRVGVQILDTSLGLAQAELDNLFSFNEWSGEALNWNMSNGLDLNLNLCLARALMRLAGGDIGATSEIGKGIQWIVELPLNATVEARADAPTISTSSLNQVSDRAASEALRAYATTGSLVDPAVSTILLVDDSPSNRLVLKSILTAAGYTVDLASDGLEALTAVRQKAYAVVLMDLAMPNMDGITAAKEIRNLPGLLARVPLIALTAYVSAADQQACLEVGFNEFLSKPIKDKDLLTALSRVLGMHEQKDLQANMPVERLAEFAKIIGVVGVFNLLDRFSDELRHRSLQLEDLKLSNFSDVKHNLYMLVCSADNFGFDKLGLAAKNLSMKLSENQLQFLANSKTTDMSATSDVFWSKELAALYLEIAQALEFLDIYVGEHLEVEPSHPVGERGSKVGQDDTEANHVQT